MEPSGNELAAEDIRVTLAAVSIPFFSVMCQQACWWMVQEHDIIPQEFVG